MKWNETFSMWVFWIKEIKSYFKKWKKDKRCIRPMKILRRNLKLSLKNEDLPWRSYRTSNLLWTLHSQRILLRSKCLEGILLDRSERRGRRISFLLKIPISSQSWISKNFKTLEFLRQRFMTTEFSTRWIKPLMTLHSQNQSQSIAQR